MCSQASWDISVPITHDTVWTKHAYFPIYSEEIVLSGGL